MIASIYSPSSGFYVIEGNEGIRTLQNLLSDNFKVGKFFAVDNYEEELGLVPNIIHYHKCDNVIEVGTNCDSSEEEENGETVSSEHDSEELESYEKQKNLISMKKIKTLNQEHTCYETSENRRAKAQILSQYFMKKVQNNPALKIKDMKEHLDFVLDLDVNESKLKRVKRLVLDKLDDQLTKMGELNKKAAKSLVSYPPKKWCRAYFDTKCKNFMVDNNFTGSFNSWIVEARQKPIIKMLEEIRVKVMNMLRKHEAEVKSWKNEFSPHAMHLFNDYRVIAQ
ncbi:hypothetical protein H5410_028683 [Solanum commersonii]|uniref:Uncharacterized protein n=1 Tax=Solanum commersonii TaxID=4109 RepID=A0A9J5Z5L7_SOLCO|nr:hypothetical protein H5410_028683 [Solanum commersonii]